MIVLKSDRELAAMAEAGGIVARTISTLKRRIAPGVMTQDLDKRAEQMIRKMGGVPAFKGYRGYPNTLCVSINDEVVHGIPSRRRLKSGDVVSIDVGVVYQGFCGDAAFTVPVGNVPKEALRLVSVAEQALSRGISAAVVGNRLGDISSAIQQCAEEHGYNVVRDFVGHGIGRDMHEAPQVPNFGAANSGPLLEAGMTLALEPMVVTGHYVVKIDPDGWTVRTEDGGLSAHVEHTIAITRDGPVVLTEEKRGPDDE